MGNNIAPKRYLAIDGDILIVTIGGGYTVAKIGLNVNGTEIEKLCIVILKIRLSYSSNFIICSKLFFLYSNAFPY